MHPIGNVSIYKVHRPFVQASVEVYCQCYNAHCMLCTCGVISHHPQCGVCVAVQTSPVLKPPLVKCLKWLLTVKWTRPRSTEGTLEVHTPDSNFVLFLLQLYLLHTIQNTPRGMAMQSLSPSPWSLPVCWYVWRGSPGRSHHIW